MVCNCFHQTFYYTIAKSYVWPTPKLEAQVSSLPFKLPHRWARQHRPPLDFFPFCFRRKQKDKKRKDSCKVFLPLSSSCVAFSWALSCASYRSMRWSTSTSQSPLELNKTCLPTPPLVQSFSYVLSYASYNNTRKSTSTIAIASRGEQNMATPLLVLLFTCLCCCIMLAIVVVLVLV